jgi:general secretion pathway protein K
MNGSQRGATLLTVMMIVALMSAVAVGVTTRLAGSIGLSRAASARADIYWTARSAVVASDAIVSGIFVNGTNRWPYPKAVAPEPMIVPLAAGEVTLLFEDASNCFNLNQLVDASGGSDMSQIHSFTRLLEGIGVDRAQASALASTAADWIDADDAALSGGAESSWYTDMEIAHATAGTAFVSLSELRALRGYEPDLIAAILPHVCLGEPGIPGRLNLNTLTPEQAVLLPALFSAGLDLPMARRLIEARPVSGWQGVEEFLSLDEISRLAEDIRNPDVLSVETSRIRSHMIVRFGNQKRSFDIMFDRQGDGSYRPGRLEEVEG